MHLSSSKRIALATSVVLIAGGLVAFFAVRSALDHASIPCEPGDWCPLNGRCTCGIIRDSSEGRCFPVGEHATVAFRLPLDTPGGVSCIHGPSYGRGTHSYFNSLFALDLTSRVDGPPGVVRAARAGRVEGVHTTCRDPGSATGYSDRCGRGFGNWVRLTHEDSVVSFYAHLARVDVRRGDTVRAGEPLGLEGITGITGHRHLHFAVQRLATHPADGKPAWRSVPFSLTFRRTSTNTTETVSVENLGCRLDDPNSLGWLIP